MSENQEITDEELLAIRTMSDFDLRMFVSEVHDHGWEQGREIIKLILGGADREKLDA